MPLTALYETLLPCVAKISDDFTLAPARCISSPYLDLRFAHGAIFKNYMYLRFVQKGSPSDRLGLYFDMGTQYYSYGLRIYHPSVAGMMALRDRIAAKPEYFATLVEKITNAGFTIYGEQYKKDHYPDCHVPSAKALLNRKTFYIGKNIPLHAGVFQAELADEIAQAFACMGELYHALKG